jgi:hypothetical protein
VPVSAIITNPYCHSTPTVPRTPYPTTRARMVLHPRSTHHLSPSKPQSPAACGFASHLARFAEAADCYTSHDSAKPAPSASMHPQTAKNNADPGTAPKAGSPATRAGPNSKSFSRATEVVYCCATGSGGRVSRGYADDKTQP